MLIDVLIAGKPRRERWTGPLIGVFTKADSISREP